MRTDGKRIMTPEAGRTMRPMLYVVVPVFNEANNIQRLAMSFDRMAQDVGQDYGVRFLVVDDGSADGTAEAVELFRGTLNLELLRHPQNLGPGRAFATAFVHLAHQVRDSDFVATIEGDNTSRLELLKQMILRTKEGFDVVLASPYLYGGGIRNTTTFRTALSNIANLFVKEALGLHGIATMSSFFRLHRGDAFLKLQSVFGPAIVDRAGFESMIEMLIKMVSLNMSISEIAMVLDTSQRAGKSKMKVLKTGFGYLTLWRDKARWVAQVDRGLSDYPEPGSL
jgi:dolichol-phosphate mannosyltransferase